MSRDADAQSSIRLYGLIDAAVTYASNTQGPHTLSENSGDVTGSHWGIAGTEDIGSGTAAVFALESGFSVTNGTSRQGGRLFGFQSYAGLSNAEYGAIMLGRQYDPVVDYVAPLSFTGHHPGGNNLSAHPYDNDNDNNTFRVDNAIKFASSNYDGLTFGTLYGFSNEAGGFDDNRVYSAAASYDAGGLVVAAGFLQANNGGSANTDGAITLTDRTFVASQQRIYAAGVNYLPGRATYGFVWSRTQLGGLDTINSSNGLGLVQNGQGASFDNFEVNASYSFSKAFRLNGEYTFTQGALSTASGEHKPRWNEVSVQTDYYLSNNTDVYAQVSYQHIQADGSGLRADITAQTPSSTDSQTVAALGLRHRF
ncbi:MAG TPA: porin [Pararobbsia sp.]|nr:porin [Pararobbsia sp.]